MQIKTINQLLIIFQDQVFRQRTESGKGETGKSERGQIVFCNNKTFPGN
jgi:hypothetical protein